MSGFNDDRSRADEVLVLERLRADARETINQKYTILTDLTGLDQREEREQLKKPGYEVGRQVYYEIENKNMAQERQVEEQNVKDEFQKLQESRMKLENEAHDLETLEKKWRLPGISSDQAKTELTAVEDKRKDLNDASERYKLHEQQLAARMELLGKGQRLEQEYSVSPEKSREYFKGQLRLLQDRFSLEKDQTEQRYDLVRKQIEDRYHPREQDRHLERDR